MEDPSCALDTGANLIFCRKSIVSKYAYTGDFVEISGVTGEIQRVPLAEIYLKSPMFNCKTDTAITVGCLDKLPYDLL